MHIIKRETLIEYGRQFKDAESALQAWYFEAKAAKWTCPQDILQRYSRADFPTDHHVIFDIKGTTYRLVVRIKYENDTRQGTIYIRWFGTHKEYDQLRIENI